MAPPPLPDGVDPLELLDTEQERVERFLASLDAAGWDAGTACTGWRRREMVAHLMGGEVYNRACLDDALPALFAEGGAAGVTDVDSFNAWRVRLSEEKAAAEVLAEWRSAAAEVRGRLRERGVEGTLPGGGPTAGVDGGLLRLVAGGGGAPGRGEPRERRSPRPEHRGRCRGAARRRRLHRPLRRPPHRPVPAGLARRCAADVRRMSLLIRTGGVSVGGSAAAARGGTPPLRK
ncbi:MAG: hypothetical protein E6J03_12965 [Chloroflexi bacterium]|nr:MAG: hypothetical protein E6J03_12965 [Chloroflexota bacterium]